MQPSRTAHTVRIFGHDYTVNTNADDRPCLDETARKLDQAMRTCQARNPGASGEHLAVLAALELVRTGSTPISTLDKSNIAIALAALRRKVDRLEAALAGTPVTFSEQHPTNP